MALNKTLNATCDLDGYFFCRMPDNALEVDVKIKTIWGKYTMFQDTYPHTEKYCSWDRADRRSSVHTRRRRTPQREVIMSSNDNTNSETDVPVGEGLGYPHKVVIDPEYAANISHTEEEELNNVEGNRSNFIGEYCEKCVGTHNRCWCNSSDWGEELVDIENPTDADPTLESKRPSPTSIRHPPSRWAEFRRRTISKSKAALENSKHMTIENSKSISTAEFNNNNM